MPAARLPGRWGPAGASGHSPSSLASGWASFKRSLLPNPASLIASGTGNIRTIPSLNPRWWRSRVHSGTRPTVRSYFRSTRKPRFRPWIEPHRACPSKPSKRTTCHEDKQNGTAAVLAALEVRSGQVQAASIRRNNSARFIRFPGRLLNAYPGNELYIIAGKGSAHRSKKTFTWVAKQKRVYLTFTPKRNSPSDTGN